MSRLSPAIYWRRRLLVLAAVFLLAWVVTILVSGGDDQPSAAPEPEVSATATVPAPSATSDVPTPAPTTEAATQVSVTSAADRCDPATVRIQPSVPAGQQAGESLRVDFLVSTTAEKPCTLVAKSRQTLVVVSAGDSTVWDSSVCSSPVLPSPVQLTPGWATLARGDDGNLSTDACTRGNGFRYAGTFQVRAALLGGEPSDARFRLGGLTKTQAEARARAEAEREAAERRKAKEARKKAAAERKRAEAERAEAARRPTPTSTPTNR